jgi:hypothetical protein
MLKQIAPYFFANHITVQNYSFFKIIGRNLRILAVLNSARAFSTDLCPAATCLYKAHMEAQAALAAWHKAYMEAQAAVASGRAPRQALLLDRTVAVREIFLR